MLATPPDLIAVPSVAIFEIVYGIAKSKQPDLLKLDLQKFLDSVHVAVFDYAACVESAYIRAQLETTGSPIGPYDILIAGTAMSMNGILVTRSTREFKRIPGLKVENWY